MDQGQRALAALVQQVHVEAAHLVGEQQAFVDHRPGGEGRQVELGEAGQVLLGGQVGQGVLQLLADGQQLPLEMVLVLDVRAPADDGLADHRHLGQDGVAQARGVHRDLAPGDEALALDAEEVLELLDRHHPGAGVLGQEAHGHGVLAHRRQIDLLGLGPVAQQAVGDLNQNPGAVAHQGVRAHGAAMVQIDQDLQTAGHDLMGFATLDIGHEPHAARIVFVARVVQTLLLRSAHRVPHSHSKSRRATTRPTGRETHLKRALKARSCLVDGSGATVLESFSNLRGRAAICRPCAHRHSR